MNRIQMSTKEEIATITIQGIGEGHVIDDAAVDELAEIIGKLFRDKSVKVVIFTGTGNMFATGPDAAELLQLNPIEARAFTMKVKDVFWTLATLPQVTIAAVNGIAQAIGCELCVACDIRIASEQASFGHPETGMGLLPGYGGTQRLTRLIGQGYAKELIFTGDVIDAAEAYRIGLVNKVVPAGKLEEYSADMAKRILKNGSYAINLAKHAINIGNEIDLDSAISLEGDLYALLFACKDHKSGLQAKLRGQSAELKDF